MWYRHQTPWLIQRLYPALTWHKPRSEKSIYLTFDDGPIPQVTPMVLGILSKYNIKATFFCVGENIDKHPKILLQILSDRHRVGNHTYHHIDGWKTAQHQYVGNFKACEQSIATHTKSQKLFRPPYGKATRAQLESIKTSHEIIMWDVLSGDFDRSLTPEDCLDNTIRATRSGSIVIFHDSIKARTNLTYALPRYIEYCLSEGYQFKTL